MTEVTYDGDYLVTYSKLVSKKVRRTFTRVIAGNWLRLMERVPCGHKFIVIVKRELPIN